MIEQKTPRWMVALALALGVLLPVLAALQYHWLDRLSKDEAVRMRATLQLAADRFAEDVNHELGRISGVFTLRPVQSTAEAGSDLARRWREWNTTAPLPGLVKDVYLVDPADGKLLRLEPREGVLREMPWPEELAEWRAYIEGLMSDDTDGMIPPAVSSVDAPAETPILLVRIPSLLEESGGARTLMEFGESALMVLIAIDEAVLAEDLFPALVDAYIAGGAEMPYEVAVVRREKPAEVVYASDSQLPLSSFEHADVKADFGHLGWSPLRGHLLPAREPASAARRRTDFVVSAQPTDSKQVMGVRVVNRLQVQYRQGNGPAGAYRLLARHRVGSLEAAVTTAKIRNMGISFGILGVLGAAAALFFVAERRARQLASQQAAFVAGVSHELRTPLTVIRMAGENLADGVVSDPEQARAYGRAVRDEGLRLTALVDQVLQLAASSAHSRDRLVLEPVPVGDVIERAVESCRPLFSAEGVEVAVSAPPDLPPLLANAESLSTAVRNLIVNAVKYRGTSRAIRIDTDAAEDTGTIRIAVRDRGIGIPADELSRLFDPFFRGRQAQDEQIHGSGLGLSLVKRIAELHGGSVAVESEPGGGSTFILNIPAAEGREL